MGKEQRNTTTDLIVTNDGQGKPSAEDNAIREKTLDSKDVDSGDDLEKEGGKRSTGFQQRKLLSINKNTGLSHGEPCVFYIGKDRGKTHRIQKFTQNYF